ncbi:hypothetical protein D3C73_1392990 [compost metagenome]
MAGAVMDFIENCEHSVIVEQPPERCVSIFHSLIRASNADGTDQAIQAPPDNGGERFLKTIHGLP